MGKGTTVKETPNSVATLQTLNETERVLINEANFMVDFFAEGAKTYWRLWGPTGRTDGSGRGRMGEDAAGVFWLGLSNLWS